MRFLCLHGIGTNSDIFSAQTSALRYELGASHVYDFVQGTVEAPLASELSEYYPNSTLSFNYFDFSNTNSISLALEQLHAFIALEGPYDGVLAYSQGAAFAATYIIQQLSIDSSVQPFKCAIFFSAARPISPNSLSEGIFRYLDAKSDGVLIHIPTAHIWGTNDQYYPDTSHHLQELCDKQLCEVVLHEQNHNIPSGSAKEALLDVTKAIRRTIRKAEQGYREYEIGHLGMNGEQAQHRELD